jgi:hypothetical protein
MGVQIAAPRLCIVIDTSSTVMRSEALRGGPHRRVDIALGNGVDEALCRHGDPQPGDALPERFGAGVDLWIVSPRVEAVRPGQRLQHRRVL